MTRSFALTSTTAILTLLAPHIAMAEISAKDVWANQVATYKAMGGAATATLNTRGNVTTLSNMVVNFAFPMNFGSAQITVDTIELVENGDETVTLRYLANSQMELSFDVTNQANGNLAMQFTGNDFDMRASGEPGDIEYTYDIPGYGVEITEMNLDGPALESSDLAFLREFAVTGMIKAVDNAGSVRITEGDMLKIKGSGAAAGTEFNFKIDGGELISGFQKGMAGTNEATYEMTLPADGVGIYGWPEALRNGMSVFVKSKTTDNVNDQEMSSNGRVVSYSKDHTDLLEMMFAFDKEGINMKGFGEGYGIDTLEETFPLPIKIEAKRIDTEIQMPLMGSDAPQPFVYTLGLHDLEIDESLLGMVDPSQALGRDPITVRLATKGNVGTTLDLLDFPALMALADSSDMPFSIHDLSMTELYLSAAGAEVTGKGDFTFDMDDLTTFDGIPAPTGAIDFTLVGVNGLIDKLVAAGFVPSQEAMGARMMMGLFAKPGEGEDTLTSKIEIDGATGAISANGQRLQ